MPRIEDFPPKPQKETVINLHRRRVEGDDLDDDRRPTITLTSDLHANILACEQALIDSNLIEVYQRVGSIVRRGTAKGKTHDGEDIVFDQIAHHDHSSLRGILAQAMRFIVLDKKTRKYNACHPPRDLAHLLLAFPDKNYPVLQGLISTPTIRRDGTILDAPGYDARTGLYFDPKGVDFGKITVEPTRKDARQALKVLLRPIFKFPFVDKGSKSVQLARMLTGVARFAIMTSPLFAYTAPAARTGKSHLIDVACIMSHGHRAPVVVASSTFEELDKQIQAMAACGDTIIALDNQDSDHSLASNALSQVLTQSTVRMRPFGQNTSMINVPSIAVVSITGNNLAIAKDLTERTILCSLDAKMEVPGSRSFKFHPIVRAMETRVTLVNAALTILRAYVVAGRPDQKLTPMGGFEDWDALVRSALVWLGCPDPYDTMQLIRDSDPSRGLHVTIMELWREQFPQSAVSIGAVVARATELSQCSKPDLLNALQDTAQKDKNVSLALGRWIRTGRG